MSTEEREIFHFLKTWGMEFVNPAEIARRAGTKKQYHEDPGWAKPVLLSMTERGIVESDMLGRYRVKPVAHKSKDTRWVAPDIAKILQENGVEVEGQGETAPDEYYEEL